MKLNNAHKHFIKQNNIHTITKHTIEINNTQYRSITMNTIELNNAL